MTVTGFEPRFQLPKEPQIPRGGTYHVCIRGYACHVFGSKISLESHVLGSKICNMNFPILGGKKFQQLSFLLDSIL